jgi:ribosomal protein S18 acetylase RimI-like enzyme
MIEVQAVQLDSMLHQAAVVELLDMYSREPMGDGQPLRPWVREQLIPGLRAQPHGCHFLAFDQQIPVGLAICFFGFSTFQAKPLLNIHDLAVLPAYRGRGVGRALLGAVEQAARQAGCCKLTLEVRGDNQIARQLYQNVGFDPGGHEPAAMAFWTKRLIPAPASSEADAADDRRRD